MRHFVVGLCLASAVLTSSAVPSAQDATYRSVIERVRLDALITDGGRPVAGLTAKDLEVFDNGVRQTLDYVSLDQIPVNVVFVFDTSESVSGQVLAALRHAVTGVTQGLRTGDQTALITFNHRLSLRAALSPNLAPVSSFVDAVEPGGGTALIDATYASIWVAEADPGRTVVTIFSDGRDTASWMTADRVIDAAKRADAVIYAVTTASARTDPFLSELTETTGGRVFDISSPGRIPAAFTSILEEFRRRYLVSYAPAGVKTLGWHRLELRVRGHRFTVKMRQGYLAGPN